VPHVSGGRQNQRNAGGDDLSHELKKGVFTMWLNLFLRCESVAEIKSLYRKLAKEHHPDHGGDNRTMQEINDAYHLALEKRNGETTTDTEGKEHTYHYGYTVEQAIMDKIAELLALRMPNVEIELIGWWIWVHGDTKPHRELLKAAGCEWHSKRTMWYWRQVRGTWSNKSFDQLRAAYGSRVFTQTDEAQQATGLAGRR